MFSWDLPGSLHLHDVQMFHLKRLDVTHLSYIKIAKWYCFAICLCLSSLSLTPPRSRLALHQMTLTPVSSQDDGCKLIGRLSHLTDIRIQYRVSVRRRWPFPLLYGMCLTWGPISAPRCFAFPRDYHGWLWPSVDHGGGCVILSNSPLVAS